MKKLSFTLAAAICIALAGCSDKSGSSTSDLKMYELVGNVKSVKVLSVNNGIENLAYNLEFDENGMATAHSYDKLWDEKIDISTERNEKNEMVKYVAVPEGGDMPYVEAKYVYDENGYMTEIEALWYGESYTTEKITYNEENNREKTVVEYNDYDMVEVDEMEYTYKNFDSKGNWTEREVRKKSYRKYGDGNIENKQTVVTPEKREIIYY